MKRVILSGGGTGGHIYPALSIADELKRQFPDAEFLFIGASDRMEMQKVPAAGYEIKGLWIAGLQRSLTLKNMLFPIKLVASLVKAYFIVRRYGPDVVIGTGGYASGPTLFVADKLGIPTLIQEQNSYPGITNKLLAKRVREIAVAYSGLDRWFPKSKIRLTGNPVRKDILKLPNRKEALYNDFGLDPNLKVLLVLGGSLGAKRINELVFEKLDYLIGLGFQILWQTGKLYYDLYKTAETDRVKVLAYIEDMPGVYALADRIISRAGASSVSELAIVGKSTLFIPSPNVAEDHQKKNALAVVDKGAAMMLEEKNFKDFESTFESFDQDDDLGNRFKKMALPNATLDIVELIKGLG
jgi:UDP-N-acetylglucosamine--N-acetylmuramyl-(pentapeptide) pyrophosphoryl-undecaprenol N-acetylglucosamine transferase